MKTIHKIFALVMLVVGLAACEQQYQFTESIFVDPVIDTTTYTYQFDTEGFLCLDLTLYAKWVNEDDGVPYTYTALDNGTVQITGYTGHRRYITIPRLIDGMEVSVIGPNAFAGQTRLREVNLPDGLTEIGENAFSGCSNMLRIQIPESVTVIGAGAFQNNVRLTQIVFEGSSKLTTIGRFAFSGCGSVSTIELPAALTYVDRLIDLPIGLFAVGMGQVFMARMTASVAAGDMESLKEDMNYGLRQVFFSFRQFRFHRREPECR